MDVTPAGPPPPPPGGVAGNRWTDIIVPGIGEWHPERMVTVVVPFHECQDALERTLAGLAEQSYPAGLLEIVIADDGSASAPVIPAVARDLNVVVVAQEHRGFGLARARNLGAGAAQGEVLVFLDCDMIPERQHIEAHARWHDAASDVVTIGSRRHADFTGSTPEAVAVAVRSGEVAGIVAGQSVESPAWMQRYLDRSDQLVAPRDDLYRVMSGGNLGIRRSLYLEAGGTDERFDRYGAEDRELGFRLLQMGAIVVPEARAVCWHQGEGARPSPAELEEFRLQRPIVDNLIAEPSYRNTQRGRSYTVPFAVVTVDARGKGADRAGRTTESVLASSFHDLMVVLCVPLEGDDAEWLRRQFRSDGRVLVTDEPEPAERRFRFSPVRIDVPAGVLFHRLSMEAIVQSMGAGGAGVISLDVPNRSVPEGRVTAEATRALNRARRGVGTGAGVEAEMEKLFGALRDDGVAFGLGFFSGAARSEDPGVPPVPPVRGLVGEERMEADLERTASELARVETSLQQANRALDVEERRRRRAEDGVENVRAQVRWTAEQLEGSEARREALEQRRSLRVAEAAGQLGRARTGGELRASACALWRSLFSQGG